MPRFLIVWLLLLIVGCRAPSKPTATVFKVANKPSSTEPLRLVAWFPESVRTKPASGRVLLFLSRSSEGEPRRKMNWFEPEPVFGIDVTGLRAGEYVTFLPSRFKSPDALAFPEPLGRLKPGTYYAQILLDQDATRRDFNQGPGNLYSRPVTVELAGDRGGTYDLVMDQVVTEARYEDTEWVNFVKIRSRLLSEFHGRDVFLQAAVLMPHGYKNEPERRYPAVYTIPGFGGRHDSLLSFASGKSAQWEEWSTGSNPFRGFEVLLDPDVPLGHSVFANSANNGPVGDALVTELIPELEKRFRLVAEARGRFVRGHSSGGWSSLWLQVAYPEFFGGCWSTAPDPVDFRAYQTVNLYEDRNGHWTRDGYPRPVARTRYNTRLTTVQFNHMESVLGYGGQLDSFDAVFSPKGTNGLPRPVMNKWTGVIDREVVEYWKRYDIRLVLETRWAELGPKLQGKLHILGGAWDTFYLEPALEYLKAFLDTKDHGGTVEILPGDHGSFMTDDVRARIWKEMAESFAR